jgi:hypothetical protein
MTTGTSPKRRGLARSVGGFFFDNNMGRVGISNSMKVAYAVNRARFRREHAFRKKQYRQHIDELLAENGPQTRPLIEMPDGWAIDTSGTLPHLNTVLENADEIIAERSGSRTTDTGAYRSFFQDVWTDEDNERYPAFLNFAMSSDVLAAVANYFKAIPVLSTTVPAGIRFVESNAEFDDRPDQPHDSQLYHIDYYSRPNVYVLVLLRDTTFDHGPWSFLPVSVTKRAAKQVRYWKKGVPYRLDDSVVYSAADKDDMIEFSYPRGSVLFIDSSACFHFGSRNSVKPRFQLMYGFSTIARTDLSEFFVTSRRFPVKESDSRLRKMLLDKRYLGEPSA